MVTDQSAHPVTDISAQDASESSSETESIDSSIESIAEQLQRTTLFPKLPPEVSVRVPFLRSIHSHVLFRGCASSDTLLFALQMYKKNYADSKTLL